MTYARVNQIGVWVPLLCSLAAFVIVAANIAAGVPPQLDENTSAHLWQILMAGQLPFVFLFAATADWHRRRHVAGIFALQMLFFVTAILPVWFAGY